MSVERVAFGAGQKDCAWPNVARLWLGTSGPAGGGGGAMVQLETNIDDMNPQLYAGRQRQAVRGGARDVWFTPIQMKKNRPAVMLSVLAPAPLEGPLCDLILRETTTLGVRSNVLDHRHEARREVHSAQTPYGPVRLKVKWVGTEPVGAGPEYDDCRALAEKAGVPTRLVYEAAVAAGQALLTSLRTYPSS